VHLGELTRELGLGSVLARERRLLAVRLGALELAAREHAAVDAPRDPALRKGRDGVVEPGLLQLCLEGGAARLVLGLCERDDVRIEAREAKRELLGAGRELGLGHDLFEAAGLALPRVAGRVEVATHVEMRDPEQSGPLGRRRIAPALRRPAVLAAARR